MEEEWRSIVGYEGIYEVSSLGRVRRIRAAKGAQVGKILSPSHDRKGYPHHGFSRDGVHRTRRLSRVVATAFAPNPDGLPVVMHLDDDVSNNRADNLRWGTHQDNTDDMLAKGRQVKRRKTHCPQGHEYDEANTRVRPGSNGRPKQECRRCAADRARIARASARPTA